MATGLPAAPAQPQHSLTDVSTRGDDPLTARPGDEPAEGPRRLWHAPSAPIAPGPELPSVVRFSQDWVQQQLARTRRIWVTPASWLLVVEWLIEGTVQLLRRWAALELIRLLATLYVAYQAFQWVRDRPERERRDREARVSAAWTVINTSSKGGSGGRDLALKALVRDSVSLAGVDLRHASLSGLAIRGANLTGALLDSVDLRYADLRCVDTLSIHAVEGCVSLEGAILRGAALTGAKLDGASIMGARLDSARLDGAQVNLANLQCENTFQPDHAGNCTSLRHADLAGAKLRGAILNGAQLDSADLSHADLGCAPPGKTDAIPNCAALKHATLVGARLVDASLVGARLDSADLTDADLHCTDSRMHVREFFVVCTDLTRATLRGARLVRTRLDKTILDSADLRGALITGGSWREASVHGANVTGVTPDSVRRWWLDHGAVDMADDCAWRALVDPSDWSCKLRRPVAPRSGSER